MADDEQEPVSHSEQLIDSRKRALEAVADYARACGWESPVVTSYIIVAEMMTETGRGVIWVTGDGNEPTEDNRGGLKRWQIRGLLSEIEQSIIDDTASSE